MRSAATSTSSGGAFALSSRYISSTSGASAARHAIPPAMISGPTGCSAYSIPVTTPKLPPPPRSAQNRSGFSRSLAVTTHPSAVTTSIESTLSLVQPKRRVRYPIPPPSVRPAIPVADTNPSTVASP